MQTQYNDPKGQAGSLKAPLGLVPPHAMEQTAWVHKLGADKYGPWNWRETGVCASTYVNAILRHLNAWRDGEDLDPESGISHLAHVACSANILMDAEYCSKLQDDRNKAQKHVGGGISYEEDWGPLDEEDPEISLFIKLKAAVDSATFDREKFKRDTDPQSCPECDALASYGSNDGPCDYHKNKTCDSKPEPQLKVADCDLKEDPRAKLLKAFFKLDKYDEAGVENDCPEAGYRILKEGEIVQDGDEVYVGEGHWCPVYIASWATPSVVYCGTYRRKLITDCDLKDEVADCDLKDQQSCPECDALATHGSNDGPCDYHKNKTCDSKPEPQEECKCGRRYVYHWLYGWICEDCDLKLSDYYP